MDHYFLRRSTTNKKFTTVAYFTGAPHHMETSDLEHDWSPNSDDYYIAVMDDVLAWNVLKYIDSNVAVRPGVEYDIVSQSAIFEVAQQITELVNI